MSRLGNLFFDIKFRNMTDADIKKIREKLEKAGIKVGVNVDGAALAKRITGALESRTFKIKVSPVVSNESGLTGRTASRAAAAQNSLSAAYMNSARQAHEAARASIVLGSSMHSNIRIGGELGSVMGNLATVFSMRDVFRNVVQIGGQLENQRFALRAILQDGGKAADMFSRIQSLAVKSPFGIMELNQYTKQLAAYNIPYHELYDTMKRLADISAGVGVDMGRIILAFGQVRSAGFLKGTELRQFTEANIPMVQKLADKFSELENRIVSAADVYEMISKRQITFEDVRGVLWDLTDDGGMFGGMQEALSESLASKWKNLSDAIAVMYGRLADGVIGSGLKGLADGLKELTKRWEYVSVAIGSAVASYAAYKIAVMSTTGVQAKGVLDVLAANSRHEASNLRVAQSYRQLTAAESGSLKMKTMWTTAELKQAAASGILNKEMALRLIATKKITVAQAGHLKGILDLTRAEIAYAANATRARVVLASVAEAFRGVGLAMKSLFLNPWTWVFSGMTAVFELWTSYRTKQEEAARRNDEILQSAKGSVSTLEGELEKLDGLNAGELNDDEIRIKLKELTSVVKNETRNWQSMLSDVFAKDADGGFVRSAKEQLDMLEAKMRELLEVKQLLLDYSDLASAMVDSTGGWFDDSVVDNMSDYADAMSEVQKRVSALAPYSEKIRAAIDAVVQSNPGLSVELAGKSLQEQIRLVYDNAAAWGVFSSALNAAGANDDLRILFFDLTRAFDKTDSALKTLEEDIVTAADVLKNAMRLDGVTDFEHLGDKWKTVVVETAEKFIDEAGVQAPRLRRAMLDLWTKAFNFSVDTGYKVPDEVVEPDKPSGGNKDGVAELWKKRADEIEKAVRMYEKWKETEGNDAASRRISSKGELANLFNGAYGFELNLEHPEKAYEYIMSRLNPGMEKQNDLLINLGVKVEDAALSDAKDRLKGFLEQTDRMVEEITSGWDLYERLLKATGNETLSGNIAFGGGVSYNNRLEHLRAEIENEMKSAGTGIGFDELTELSGDELTRQGYAKFKKLIEAYNKERKKLTADSVNNFIDILNASKDFGQRITEIEKKLQKDLSDLRLNASGMSAEDLKRREDELTSRAEEEKTGVWFEDFKKSSDWVKVFDNLNRVSDSTLDAMILKIKEFAKQAHLSEEVTKQLVDAMGKLRDESIKRNPFGAFANAWERLSSLRNASRVSLNGTTLYDVKRTSGDTERLSEKEYEDAKRAANDELEKSSLAVVEKFQTVADASNLLCGLFENMGVSMDGFLGSISDVIGGAGSGARTGSSVAQAFGATGPWGAIAGAAVGMLSSVFAMHDKALQKEIEASEAREKAIGRMADNLESVLSGSLGSVYTFSLDDETKSMLRDIRYERDGVFFRTNRRYSDETRAKAHEALREDSYYDAQLAALMAQRDEVREQMRLEDDKKKTDKAKMSDYKQELAELDASIKDFAEDMAGALYGIDFKDWANRLSEALVDAWASGEDAVQAYKDTVDEILKDLGVSVITQKLIEPLLQDTMDDFLAQFEKDNGKLTDSSMDILRGMYEGADEAAKATSAYLEGLKQLGIDFSGESESVGGGLSKGIQGVTEDTADLLASYINAIRADVSAKRVLMEKFVGEDVPKMSYLAEAQLQQLQLVVRNTQRNADAAESIYELVNRVIDKGSNKLKV